MFYFLEEFHTQTHKHTHTHTFTHTNIYSGDILRYSLDTDTVIAYELFDVNLTVVYYPNDSWNPTVHQEILIDLNLCSKTMDH